jgi:hypothetical protein
MSDEDILQLTPIQRGIDPACLDSSASEASPTRHADAHDDRDPRPTRRQPLPPPPPPPAEIDPHTPLGARPELTRPTGDMPTPLDPYGTTALLLNAFHPELLRDRDRSRESDAHAPDSSLFASAGLSASANATSEINDAPDLANAHSDPLLSSRARSFASDDGNASRTREEPQPQPSKAAQYEARSTGERASAQRRRDEDRSRRSKRRTRSGRTSSWAHAAADPDACSSRSDSAGSEGGDDFEGVLLSLQALTHELKAALTPELRAPHPGRGPFPHSATGLGGPPHGTYSYVPRTYPYVSHASAAAAAHRAPHSRRAPAAAPGYAPGHPPGHGSTRPPRPAQQHLQQHTYSLGTRTALAAAHRSDAVVHRSSFAHYGEQFILTVSLR